MDTQILGYKVIYTQILGFKDTWTLRYCDTRIHRHSDTVIIIQGYIDTQIL